MFQPNDPVGISVQMSAKLFAIMADEVLQACGEDKGEEIVRRAVRRYAELRAAGIRKEILDAGKEVTFETVEEFSDYPPATRGTVRPIFPTNSCTRSPMLARFPRHSVRSAWSMPEVSTGRRSTSL